MSKACILGKVFVFESVMVRMKGLEKICRSFIKDYISLYSPKIRYFKLIITFLEL